MNHTTLTDVCEEHVKVPGAHYHGWICWPEQLVINNLGLADADCALSRNRVLWQIVLRSWILGCTFGVLVGYGCDLDSALHVRVRQNDDRMLSDLALIVASATPRVQITRRYDSPSISDGARSALALPASWCQGVCQ